jgi:5-methylcytosine-specific restriction endonuclease McrA
MQATPIIITGDGAYKECIGCGDFKPLLDFPRSARTASGRNYRCKPCYSARSINGLSNAEYRKKWRAAKPAPIDDNQIIVTAAGNFRICKRCNEVESTNDFYATRLECRSCTIAKTAAYAAKNQDIVADRATRYRQTPKAKELQRARYIVWLEKHGSNAHSLAVASWRKSNPEKALRNSRKYVLTRRARLANAPGIFDYDAWMKKVDYHGWKCFYCPKILTPKTLTIEHRKALSKGGSNWTANLVPACKSCNSSKGVKAWQEK